LFKQCARRLEPARADAVFNHRLLNRRQALEQAASNFAGRALQRDGAADLPA
jgi:hypothetical protein